MIKHLINSLNMDYTRIYTYMYVCVPNKTIIIYYEYDMHTCILTTQYGNQSRDKTHFYCLYMKMCCNCLKTVKLISNSLICYRGVVIIA